MMSILGLEENVDMFSPSASDAEGSIPCIPTSDDDYYNEDDDNESDDDFYSCISTDSDPDRTLSIPPSPTSTSTNSPTMSTFPPTILSTLPPTYLSSSYLPSPTDTETTDATDTTYASAAPPPPTPLRRSVVILDHRDHSFSRNNDSSPIPNREDDLEPSLNPRTKRALSQISIIRSSFRTLQSRSTYLSSILESVENDTNVNHDRESLEVPRASAVMELAERARLSRSHSRSSTPTSRSSSVSSASFANSRSHPLSLIHSQSHPYSRVRSVSPSAQSSVSSVSRPRSPSPSVPASSQSIPQIPSVIPSQIPSPDRSSRHELQLPLLTYEYDAIQLLKRLSSVGIDTQDLDQSLSVTGNSKEQVEDEDDETTPVLARPPKSAADFLGPEVRDSRQALAEEIEEALRDIEEKKTKIAMRSEIEEIDRDLYGFDGVVDEEGRLVDPNDEPVLDDETAEGESGIDPIAIIDAFLTDDDGVHLLHTVGIEPSLTIQATLTERPQSPPSKTKPPTTQSRGRSRSSSFSKLKRSLSLTRIAALFGRHTNSANGNGTSVDASSTVTPHSSAASSTTTTKPTTLSPTLRLPLTTFLSLVDSPSLSQSQVLSIETYKESTGVRFLLMHLWRKGRKDVWLRIDRVSKEAITLRRRGTLTLRRLMSLGGGGGGDGGGGRGKIEDTVRLAAEKSKLLDSRRFRLENILTFGPSSDNGSDPGATFPRLGAVQFDIQVICEELVDWNIWPENGWLLCSMIQDLLAEANNGYYTLGGALNQDLGKDIRARVHDRVFHVPGGSRISDLLQSLAVSGTYWRDIYLPKAIIQAEHFDSLRGGGDDLVPETQFIDMCETLKDLSSRTEILSGLHLAGRSIAFYRIIYSIDPQKFADRFIAALNNYVDRLKQLEMAGGEIPFGTAKRNACDGLWEIVGVNVELYEKNPQSRAAHNRLMTSIKAAEKQMRRWWSFENLNWDPFHDFIEVYRSLYRRNPERWHSELHDLLNDWIEFIGGYETRHWQDLVCRASRQLVDLYRPTYEAHPDLYETSFCGALEVQASSLTRARRFPEACDVSQGMVDVLRAAFQKRPDAHARSKLSQALDQHARRLFKHGRSDDACDALKEAADIHREPYATDPVLNHTALVDALNRFAAGLNAAGRESEAQDAEKEVETILHSLFGGNSAAYEESVHSAAHRMSTAAPYEASGASTDESTAVEAVLAAPVAMPDVQTITPSPSSSPVPDDDTQSQHDSSGDSSSTNTETEDLPTTVSRLRNRYIVAPSAKGYEELVQALSKHAEQLAANEELNKACDVAFENVQIDRAQYAAHPLEHNVHLARSLSAYATRLAAAERVPEACDAALEAVSIDRARLTFDIDGDAMDEGTLERLHGCCQVLMKAGRPRDAMGITMDTVNALKDRSKLGMGPGVVISPYWMNEWAKTAELLKAQVAALTPPTTSAPTLTHRRSRRHPTFNPDPTIPPETAVSNSLTPPVTPPAPLKSSLRRSTRSILSISREKTPEPFASTPSITAPNSNSSTPPKTQSPSPPFTPEPVTKSTHMTPSSSTSGSLNLIPEGNVNGDTMGSRSSARARSPPRSITPKLPFAWEIDRYKAKKAAEKRDTGSFSRA